jgi:hypothetical protein
VGVNCVLSDKSSPTLCVVFCAFDGSQQGFFATGYEQQKPVVRPAERWR